jgi:hypothetical protein
MKPELALLITYFSSEKHGIGWADVRGIRGLTYSCRIRQKYSHELRRIVAEESAKSSFDEAAELIVQRIGVFDRQRPEGHPALSRTRSPIASPAGRRIHPLFISKSKISERSLVRASGL